ncbi:NAD(P)-binding protein, partial [Lindgomyces ingoldianus]
GNVGSAIINELLKDGPHFNITAIIRPTSTYTAPPNSSIITKIADFTSLSSLADALEGHDAVANCISGGATQFEPMKLIIDAAIAAGVKFFFADEYVGNLMCDQFKRLPESFAGAKIRIRGYLEELGRQGKIQWTALNGGPFFDMWPAGFNIPARQARIYGTGNNPICWTPLPTIALAAANMLRNPAPAINRPIYINGVQNLTQNALLSAVETVVGEKLTVEQVDVNKINKHALIALERGEIEKAMKGLTISNQFYDGDNWSWEGVVMENELVGVEPVSVEAAVEQAIEKWGKDCPVVEAMFRVEACDI